MALEPAQRMPHRVDVPAACRQSATFAGRLEAADLPRLSEAGWLITTPLDCELHFDVVGGNQGIGRLSGQLQATCQRCLELMQLAVNLKWRWQLVASDEEAEQRSEDCWVLDEGQWLVVRTAVEDELLLGLPLAPRHAAGERCVESSAAGRGPSPAAQKNPRRPFADALAGIKVPRQTS